MNHVICTFNSSQTRIFLKSSIIIANYLKLNQGKSYFLTKNSQNYPDPLKHSRFRIQKCIRIRKSFQMTLKKRHTIKIKKHKSKHY